MIVALTASGFEEERSEILAAGCDDYVRKPFHEADLFEKLAQHLGVRYLYDEESQPADRDDRVQEALGPEALSGLPTEWVAKLHDAASRARGDLVMGLLSQIEEDHPRLAEALARLVDDYRFGRVVSLTESCL